MPACAALTPALARLREDRFPDLDELNQLCAERAIVSGGGLPLRFVEQPARADRAYEAQAYLRGEVWTRSENWHDLFNALVWISFPLAKAEINRRHYRELQARGEEGTRGTPRDVLTLFDESGAIVACAEPELAALLRARAWKELFWERRADLMRSMRVHVFGHAICEKALRPYKGITAKTVIFDVRAEDLLLPLPQQIAQLDARLARHFSAQHALVAGANYAPLPLLGLPGWTADNEEARYYDDVQHFRPARTATG